MYPAGVRDGSHVGAMVFVGAIGLVLVVVFGLCGGGGSSTPPRAQATPVPTATAPLPKLSDLDSAWIDQTPPAQLTVGAEAAITFKFRNTGKVAWTRGTGSEASLAFVGSNLNFDPKMAVNWPQPGRPAVQSEEVVAPNEIATFTFKVKGVTAGTYRIDVRPVVAAVGPMRDQGVYTEVTVR
jgi:hypothetical protein